MWPYLHYSQVLTNFWNDHHSREVKPRSISLSCLRQIEFTFWNVGMCDGVSAWRRELKMSTRTRSNREGLFKPRIDKPNDMLHFYPSSDPPLWSPKGYLHAALNLWGSKMDFKLPPQKPWELFLSACEWPPNVFAVETISLSSSQMLFDLTSI